MSVLVGSLWADAPGPMGAPSASAVDACFHPVDFQPRDVPPGTTVHLSIELREHGFLEPCQYAASSNNTWTVYWYAEDDPNRPADKVQTFNSPLPFTATFDFAYTTPGLHYPKALICGSQTCTSRWSVLPGILGGDGINVLPWAFCWEASAPTGTYAGEYRAGKPVTFRITTRTAWVFIWPLWIINPACNSIDPDIGNVQIEFDHDPDANPNTRHVSDTVSVIGYDVTAVSNATYPNAQRHYPAARLCGWKAGNRTCTNWYAAYPQEWDANPLSPGFQVRWFEQCFSVPAGYPRPADPNRSVIRPAQPVRLAFELRDPAGGCAAAKGRWGENWTLEWFFHDGSADPNAPYTQDTSTGTNGSGTNGTLAFKDHTWPAGSNRYPKGRLCMSQGCAVDIFGKQWWEAYPFGWNGITIWNSPPNISLVKFRPATSGDVDPSLPTPVRPDEDVFYWASATDPDGDQIVAAQWDMGDVEIVGPLPDVSGQPILGTGAKFGADVLAADPNSPGSWYAQLTKSYWDAGVYPNPRNANRHFYFPSVRFQDQYGAWSDWTGWNNVLSLTPCNPLFLFICAQDIVNSAPAASLGEWSPEISHPGWNIWFPAAAVDGNGDKVLRVQYRQLHRPRRKDSRSAGAAGGGRHLGSRRAVTSCEHGDPADVRFDVRISRVRQVPRRMGPVELMGAALRRDALPQFPDRLLAGRARPDLHLSRADARACRGRGCQRGLLVEDGDVRGCLGHHLYPGTGRWLLPDAGTGETHPVESLGLRRHVPLPRIRWGAKR
ncbi:MAG: hypothetical protein DYH08_10955 [Actinobacteria bacterium ATB1]|nr:hypothetical protein [Actinobacteria bacterium ATB1]